jgi:hypothetical protein
LTTTTKHFVRTTEIPIGYGCYAGIIGSLGLLHRQKFQILENSTSRKLDLFPFSGDGEGNTLLGPLERALLPLDENRGYLFLRDPTEQVSPSPYLKVETDPGSETLRFLVFRTPDDGQSLETQ